MYWKNPYILEVYAGLFRGERSCLYFKTVVKKLVITAGLGEQNMEVYYF